MGTVRTICGPNDPDPRVPVRMSVERADGFRFDADVRGSPPFSTQGYRHGYGDKGISLFEIVDADGRTAVTVADSVACRFFEDDAKAILDFLAANLQK